MGFCALGLGFMKKEQLKNGNGISIWAKQAGIVRFELRFEKNNFLGNGIRTPPSRPSENFTVLTCSPTGRVRFSFLDLSLKWNISHNKTKQAIKFLEISITGYLAFTQQRKRKRKLTFSDNTKWAGLTSGLNAEHQPVPRQSCAMDLLGFPWSCGVPVVVT